MSKMMGFAAPSAPSRPERQTLATAENGLYVGYALSQEAPSDVRLQQLQSVFRYLDKAFPRRSRLLRPLFKLCFLGTLAGRFFGTGAKVLVYWLLGRSAKTERHWQRWKRDVLFLWQFDITFLFFL